MGYYTRFELEVDIDGSRYNETSEELIRQLRKECEEAEYCLEDDGGMGEEGRWYEWEEDLKKFSKKHPEAIFHLAGTGEEYPDFWRATVVNGKAHIRKAKIEYDEFDPKKLR